MQLKSPQSLSVAALAVLALALAAPASGQILFDAQLTGFAEVPPVGTTASGSCTGVLTGFPGTENPSFHITCEHNVANAMAAHIHPGVAGEENDFVFNLGNPHDIDETWNLTVDQAIRLLSGGYYVNVHSPSHADGEIRGQLEARQTTTEGVEVLTFALTGDQEVPPVTTDRSGRCVATIELDGLPEQGTLDLFCTHDVDDATLAHIHRGAVGVAGPPVIDLEPASPIIAEDIFLTPQLASDLRQGLLYVNVHSPAHPGGEIRGQLTGCFGSTTVLCLENGRFAVTVAWATTRNEQNLSGQGVAVPETDNTGMFWFFEPSNLEIMIKVLDACVPPFDRFWVFFAGLTDVGFELRVTDTATNDTQTYSNADRTVVIPVLDTDAFDTCDVP